MIHANPAHPENHNVLFKSLNSGYARVYNGNEFEDRQSTEVQDTILANVGSLFSTKCCDGYYFENEKQDMDDILDELDEQFLDHSKDVKENNNSRSLSKCRNVIKAALHSKRNEIEAIHNCIEN